MARRNDQRLDSMIIFPNPRMTAISRALFRRLRDGIATVILNASSILVLFSAFFFMLSVIDCVLIAVGAKYNFFPAYVYLPLFACGLACATGWISFCRSPAPPPPPLGGAQTSFLSRARALCARGPRIFESALNQFFNGATHSPGDPRTSSLFQRYRNRLSASGSGSIVAAIAVSTQAIPAFFIAIGLMILGIAGGLAAFLLGILAKLSGSPLSPLVSARSWASRVVDRLVAEGSSDLAASEAALLDQSLPASPTAGKPPRL